MDGPSRPGGRFLGWCHCMIQDAEAASAFARGLCNGSNSFCPWRRTASSSFSGPSRRSCCFTRLASSGVHPDVGSVRPFLCAHASICGTMGALGVCCVRERHVCSALPSIEPLDQNLGRKKVFDFCTCQVASTRATFQYQVGVARIQGLTQRLNRLATFAVAIEQRDRESLVSATENARNGPDAFDTTSRREHQFSSWLQPSRADAQVREGRHVVLIRRTLDDYGVTPETQALGDAQAHGREEKHRPHRGVLHRLPVGLT